MRASCDDSGRNTYRLDCRTQTEMLHLKYISSLCFFAAAAPTPAASACSLHVDEDKDVATLQVLFLARKGGFDLLWIDPSRFGCLEKSRC